VPIAGQGVALAGVAIAIVNHPVGMTSPLLAGQSWARFVGIFFVSLDLLVQFGTFTLFPLWAMMIIALDIVILYQLCVRWEPELR
jgi:hypothetical protein